MGASHWPKHLKAASAGMIWCFVRIPGRSISHIAAEVALMTHPHVVLMPGSLIWGR